MKLFSILLLFPLLAYALPEPEANPSPKIGDGKPTAKGQEAIDAGLAILPSDPAAKSLISAPLESTKRSTKAAMKVRAILQARDQICEVVVPVGDVLNCYAGPSTIYTLEYYLSNYSEWDILCYEEDEYIDGNPYVSARELI